MRFNINAPFWRFMDTLLRFVGLNLVYLITLIPNVTIGPARAALYSTMFAYDEHDDIRLVKEYLTRFKREFKQGLAAWVLVAILAAAILFGLSFWKAWDTNASYIPLILLVIAAVVVALTALQPPLVLFAGFVVYAISGYVVSTWMYLKRARAARTH